jgi:16S rRNA (cytosine967-C5)-methyltransferase
MKPGVDVRVRAGRAVADVAARGVSLSRALPDACADVEDPRDLALLKALVFGTVRAYLRLARLVALCLDRPLTRGKAELEALLCVGLYQLAYMRVAPHAAVAATVDAARALRGDGAAGLVNAVLRRYQREHAAVEATADADEQARFMHPHWLLARMREDWPDDWRAIADGGNAEPPMWLRVNLARVARGDYERLLGQEHGVEVRPSPHAMAALRITPPRDVASLPGFDTGLVSVQDAAAQLAVPLLDLAPGLRVLDACAAPGGKTAHILEHRPDAQVTAVDADAARLARVQEGLARLGLSARLVCADAGAPATWWNGTAFDRILLDAPCTATGVIRRHPDIKLLRRADDVVALAREQARLLDALWPLLAPGGRFVYVTCSVLLEEGAAQVERMLDRNADARCAPIVGDWGRACGPGRQVLPGEDAMDGFYYSCLDKLIPSPRA